ncbi:LacI family DNA-binding transcriptional regulator [Nesterenkonia muleiensis]|uniref:LacI family DNA-binding transcriptional regulator n=1 Tax=Nesterenkonia muleiensis TaxID=2282648 RepID=UPI000E720FF5|nr:LacI family DNA-binding transcriptional regulator [Nesterenkonia muleiensis]
MAVRLAEVAEAAGVSQATASRVLNGSNRRPAPEVADKVRAAAERLGYVPNAQAQALVRASARLIGLVVHDIADPYFSSIARGAQRGLAGSGIQLMLASTERAAEAEVEAVRSFMSYRTDAILLAGSRGFGDDVLLERLLQAYRGNGGRVAMIGQPLASAGGVQIDNEGSAAALADELLRLGHRRFAVLSGEPELQTASQRAAGFLATLKSAGVMPEVVSQGAFTREGGYRMMVDLLASGVSGEERKLCVFCVNDVMALGALAALREAGLSVPEDVALAGFDDIPTLADQYPTISTVRLPLEEIGRMSVEMMLGNSDASHRVVVEGAVVLRQSTRLS